MILLVPTVVETANRHDRFESDKAKLHRLGVNDFTSPSLLSDGSSSRHSSLLGPNPQLYLFNRSTNVG